MADDVTQVKYVEEVVRIFCSSFRGTSLIYANYYGTHISAILVHHRRNNIDIFGVIIRWLLFGGIICLWSSNCFKGNSTWTLI